MELRIGKLKNVSDHALKLQRRFGDALRAERLGRKISQERLALSSGISPTYVGEVERGEKMASLEIITRLAKALHLSGAELLRKAGL
jgi:transcriptional regulator with XRE-family HTH domain